MHSLYVDQRTWEIFIRQHYPNAQQQKMLFDILTKETSATTHNHRPNQRSLYR